VEEEPVHMGVKVIGALVLASIMLAFAGYITLLGAEHGSVSFTPVFLSV
jgi:hypothetical protein